MNKVEYSLQTYLPGKNWTITQPQDGAHKKSYIAQCEEVKVFLKFDVPAELLKRLGEIGVGPQVVASGSIDEETYVLQNYLAGNYPDGRWLANHLPLLAQVIKRYHTDRQLTLLLKEKFPISYAEHLRLDLEQLEKRFFALNGEILHTPEIALAFHTLQTQAQNLQSTTLVPVHADPNTKNMLVVSSALYLLDWDEIALSDPLRDIGLVLWWYIPPQKWPEFFAAYDLQPDEKHLTKIYWWCARTSFSVALWLAERGYDCWPFLQDFLAAIKGEDNPHAVFRRNQLSIWNETGCYRCYL